MISGLISFRIDGLIFTPLFFDFPPFLIKPASPGLKLFSSSLSAIRVVSSVYLRLLIFLPAILIPACDSSSPEFLFMYSFPSFEPVCCSMFDFNCCFLTCIQVSQETGKVVWYSHLLKNFPQFVVIHTVKGFKVVNEADVLLEFPYFLYDPTHVGNLITSCPVFSKSSLYIWKFSVHVLLKPSLKDFEHYLAIM